MSLFRQPLRRPGKGETLEWKEWTEGAGAALGASAPDEGGGSVIGWSRQRNR